ncbi:MAG TPA: hypothetical protein PLR82_08630, partial [Bacillota bacterium]|nr:hypothetical protein [Bacillota bacterium]
EPPQTDPESVGLPLADPPKLHGRYDYNINQAEIQYANCKFHETAHTSLLKSTLPATALLPGNLGSNILSALPQLINDRRGMPAQIGSGRWKGVK